MASTQNKKKWIKTFQFLAAYLVAAWTFLQFVDWILNRYNISPYWVDMLLWAFIGIIPSLLIYLQHQERINKRILKLREKIIFPLNVILLSVALYFGFGNSDLGATTKEVKYTNEQGEAQSTTITKEEFRIGIPVYGFENLTNIDSLNWMRYGIGRLIVEDLSQNKSLSPDFYYFTNTSTKIEESSLFNDFYIDGKYEKNEDDYVITAYKRKANNGKILNEITVKGKAFLPLIDELTVFITEHSGFVENKNIRYLDYPINEFMSNSMDAIREYINGNYAQAVNYDNRFALAYLQNAKRSLRRSRGKLEVQDLADKAFEYRNRLPLQKQLEAHIQRNLAYGNYDEAEQQVKLQLEVDPHNEFYNQVLFSIYGETHQTNDYLTASERLFDIDPNPESGRNLAIAAMVHGDDDRLISEIKKYEIFNPSLKVFRLQPLLFKEDINKAEALLEDIKTLFPSFNNRVKVYDSAVAYLKQNGYKVSDLKKFEGTYRSANSEQEHTFWIANNRLIQSIKNQAMEALLPAGPNSAVKGFMNDITYKYELIFNNSGEPIAIRCDQYDYKNSGMLWYWKEDDVIKKAHDAFDSGNYKDAERLYETATEKNPEHIYLKNSLQHLQYIKSISHDSLVLQHKTFEGVYGQRKFWEENGKFYYKRQSDDVDLPRLELLAIDENTYMDVTRLHTLMEFVKDSVTGKLASSSLSYNIETKKWALNHDGDKIKNYFLKDD